MCILSISAGAASFLKIVFEGSWDVGMNHQPNVGLVDPHAESVGRSDHTQLAHAQLLLHGILVVSAHTCVKMLGIDPLSLEELGHPLGLLARRTIDDAAGSSLLWHELLDDRQDIAELAVLCRGAHIKRQIGARGATIEGQEIDPRLVSKMPDDVLDNFGLCRGRQADDRRGRLIAGEIFYKATEVAIIWSEIMAPLKFGK